MTERNGFRWVEAVENLRRTPVSGPPSRDGEATGSSGPNTLVTSNHLGNISRCVYTHG